MTSIAVSKVGMHSAGSRRYNWGELLQTVNAAGRCLSLVKCREDMGAAWEAKQLWPDCLTIGAWGEFDDMAVDYNRLKLRMSQNPWIDYAEIHNEIDGEWAAQTNQYIDLLPRLYADRIGLCAFNCAEGTPQYPSIDPVPYAEITRFCKFVIDNGYYNNVILGFHEYGTGTDHVQRYHVLRDHLAQHGALIRMVCTEYGPIEAGYIAPAAMLAYVQENDQIDMTDPVLIGRALWTTGVSWVSSFAQCLPLVAEYIATVPPIHVPPPPEPAVIGDVTCLLSDQAAVTAAIVGAGGKVEWY